MIELQSVEQEKLWFSLGVYRHIEDISEILGIVFRGLEVKVNTVKSSDITARTIIEIV